LLILGEKKIDMIAIHMQL